MDATEGESSDLQNVVAFRLGQQAYAPKSFTAPVDSLDFVIPDAPLGNHLARLRIDGIDSPIINHGTTPPTFYDMRINIT